MAISNYKNSYASFSYVPSSAIVGSSEGVNPSVNIGMPDSSDTSAIANNQGLNPYMPVEGLLTNILTEQAVNQQNIIFHDFYYNNPTPENEDYAFPYTFLDLEGIIITQGYGNQYIHDFFRMTYNLTIGNPNSSAIFHPSSLSILGVPDQQGEPTTSIISPTILDHILTYVPSAQTYNSKMDLIINLQTFLPLSYNIKYLLM